MSLYSSNNWETSSSVRTTSGSCPEGISLSFTLYNKAADGQSTRGYPSLSQSSSLTVRISSSYSSTVIMRQVGLLTFSLLTKVLNNSPFDLKISSLSLVLRVISYLLNQSIPNKKSSSVVSTTWRSIGISAVAIFRGASLITPLVLICPAKALSLLESSWTTLSSSPIFLTSLMLITDMAVPESGMAL